MRRGSKTSLTKITQYCFHGICNHQDSRSQLRNELVGTELKQIRHVTFQQSFNSVLYIYIYISI